MKTYSPFDKPLKDLLPSDLESLRRVSEGWYVEYKQTSINASAIAKSLSAFANTYGGWIFFGIKEKSKDDPVAGAFSGILNDELDGLMQTIRNSSIDHIVPTPAYEIHTLRGPCVEIFLLEGSSILAVEVRQSQNTPHVHKDGRIYRRVADSSAPKHETDRFLLDQLWRRGDRIRDLTRKWVAQEPEFSKAEAELPYVRFLLCPDPWRQRGRWIDSQFSKIRKVFMEVDAVVPEVLYDTVYTMGDHIIARHVKGNDPSKYVLTWRVTRDCVCEVIVPLPLQVLEEIDEFIVNWDGYTEIKKFAEILSEYPKINLKVVDLNYVMLVLTDVVWKYQKLLKLANAETDFYFKVQTLNVWRMVPFLDIDTVLGDFKEYGIPMTIDKTVTVPIGDGPESFFHVIEPKLEKKYQGVMSIVIQASLMFAIVAKAFGISRITINDDPAEDLDVEMIPYEELRATGDRAMNVQRKKISQKGRNYE